MRRPDTNMAGSSKAGITMMQSNFLIRLRHLGDVHDHRFACGDLNGLVRLWDLRNTRKELNKVLLHALSIVLFLSSAL
jgi:hypothetical protein